MNEGLPWFQMLVMLGLLVAMFVGPFAAIKIHGHIRSRRAAQPDPD